MSRFNLSLNTFAAIRKALTAGLFASMVAIAGCSADGDGSSFPGGGGGGGGGGGVTDVTNCQVPLGTTLCVLGGDDHAGGLVDVLLAEDGPLGPIAGAIDVSALTIALQEMLESDGTLTGLVTGLLADGQLQEGLELLLLGDGNGEGGLAELIGGLLLPNEEGTGLIALFGEDGITDLVTALLIDGTSSDCQAPLGTLCLIAGDGTDQMGLVDLLLTSDGVLASLSPTATGGTTDQIVEILGDLLESDGSLANLVEGLLVNGQLAEGLQALLVGDPEAGVEGGLVQGLGNLLGGLGDVVTDLVDFLGGLFGLGG